MPTQIEVLASLQQVDQSLRSKTLAVAESEGRVAALEEAVRGQTGAATAGPPSWPVVSGLLRNRAAGEGSSASVLFQKPDSTIHQTRSRPPIRRGAQGARPQARKTRRPA